MTEIINKIRTSKLPKVRLPREKSETLKQEAGLLLGFFLFGYGVYTVHPSAAFIICGAMLMYFFFPRGD